MRFDPAKHPHTRDLTGKRFGRLTVVAFSGVRARTARVKETMWRCKCSCGGTAIVVASKLKSGWTTSCGCWQREAPQRSKKNLKHGRYQTPEYLAWSAMKQRCLNPNYHHFENWGGRGITVCQRWIDSFEAFFADMGERPSPKHSLDRRNNNGNYNKRNCRWSISKDQAINRR